MDDGWEPVLYRGLRCDKLEGVFEKKRIYVIGPCVVESQFSITKNSLVAQLQGYVHEYGYEVIRMVCPIQNPDLLHEISCIPVRKDDIVMLIYSRNYLGKEKGFAIDLTDLFNQPREEIWTLDGVPLHINSVANKAVVAEIFNKCVSANIINKDNSVNNMYLQKGEILSDELQKQIFEYVENIKPNFIKTTNSTCEKKIGAIVMNCNPFTNGHLYLIEKSASVVDLLYIFVVQEDKSFFSFEDRFELVKKGTEHIDNVVVVPSGEYVLSYKTLRAYFTKESLNTAVAVVDASVDLELFARYIAPEFGIVCRFAGEEPFDMVTKKYNEQMAEILPEFGIEFVEIPRKKNELDGEVISASRVRKLMAEGRIEDIRQLVPQTTYDYIVQLEKRQYN